MGGRRQLKRRESAVARHHVAQSLARLLLEAALDLVRQEKATARPDSENKKLPAGEPGAATGSRGSNQRRRPIPDSSARPDREATKEP